MATAGGQVYGAQALAGPMEHFNNNGTFSPMTGPISSVTSSLGMWGDPVNGHLISASSIGLIDIDPTTGNFRVINGSLFPDGVTVSLDGNTIYVENSGTIQSYNFTTGTLIQTYNFGHSPDGTGVIAGGLFNGDVIVNDDDGTVRPARSSNFRIHNDRTGWHPRRLRIGRHYRWNAVPVAG